METLFVTSIAPALSKTPPRTKVPSLLTETVPAFAPPPVPFVAAKLTPRPVMAKVAVAAV